MTEILKTEADVAIDEALIVRGAINIRKTHPGLYRMKMVLALGFLALGINFLVFVPTFLVYGLPNWLWATVFLTLGCAKIVFLNFYRSLPLTRATMGLSVAFLSVFAMGTMQPAFEGKGSLQLPILYWILVVWNCGLLLEPFINPYTARRNK